MLDRPDHNRRAEQRRLRDRRHRERLKAHKRVALVEFDGAILDLLLRTGWAREAELGDARAVGEAIARLLIASAENLNGAANGRCPHCGREW